MLSPHENQPILRAGRPLAEAQAALILVHGRGATAASILAVSYTHLDVYKRQPAERRGAAFGFHRAGDSLGAVIGLGLALLVVWLTQGNALTLDRATFQRIALFSAVPGLLLSLIHI